jgi:hypothetical protein
MSLPPDHGEAIRDAMDGNGHRPGWKPRALSLVTAQRTGWLVPGLIPLRFITQVAGVGGLGKSTWVMAIAAAGSIAAEPWDTIYVTFEDTAEEMLRPRLEAAHGDPERVHELVCEDATSLASFTLPGDLEGLQAAVRQVSARLVVIDPIVAAIDASLDAYKDQHVRRVLAELWRISREENCAVVNIGHLNRVPSTDAYLRIANSVAFWNASRSVVLITEDADDEDGRLVAQRKANLARLAPVERHRIEEVVLDLVDPETGQPIVATRMRFVEIADDVDSDEILAAPRRATKADTAEALLAALLVDGKWHESGAVKKVMEAAGHPERTAQRAARDLPVEVERRGFPSVTYWRVSVAPDTVAPSLDPNSWRDCENPIDTGDSGSRESSRAKSRHDGATETTVDCSAPSSAAHRLRWEPHPITGRIVCWACHPPAALFEQIAAACGMCSCTAPTPAGHVCTTCGSAIR